MSIPGLAHVIAGHLNGLKEQARQRETVDQATRCLVDFFAVSLAGRGDPVAASVLKVAACGAEGAAATVLCSGARTSAPLAALANGTVAHVLDFDDTLWTYVGHATAVVLPAVFAVAESSHCTGIDLLAGFALGVEAAHLFGAPVSDALRGRGFHPTPTIGTLAAAAAAALVLGEDSQCVWRALTLATNMASGLRQNFGSPAKPISAGWAAHAGVMAALMARQGLAGSEDALEGPQGFYQATSSSDVDITAIKSQEMTLVSPGIGFKLYPCCTGTHPAIEALLSIRRDLDPHSTRIKTVDITVTPEVQGELIYPMPAGAHQARFSLPFCAAVAFLDGEVRLDHFREPFSIKPGVLDLMQRIRVRPDGDLERTGGANCPAARVTVTTGAGSRYERHIGAARGNPSNPASDEDLDRKFVRCAAAGGFPEVSARSLLSEVRSFRNVPSLGDWVRNRLVPLLEGCGRPEQSCLGTGPRHELHSDRKLRGAHSER